MHKAVRGTREIDLDSIHKNSSQLSNARINCRIYISYSVLHGWNKSCPLKQYMYVAYV